MESKIIQSLFSLESYILKENFKGYDPYDGLMSPIFRLPVLRDNKFLRFGFQQVFRRIPFNLRPLLRIKKGLNPVTLGLSIQAFTYLSQIFKDKEEFYRENINQCMKLLISLQSRGYSGSCWGYDFDWEARYTRIDAFVPTIVATGIITNALYEYYKIYRDEKAKDLILSASQFVLKDLNRTSDEEGNFCFSYSPNDKQVVFNATMKGARLLAQSYSINGEPGLLNTARKIVTFVMKCQKRDGSWSYSRGDARSWVDNFHTAYILDCLDEYLNLSRDDSVKDTLMLGKEYYINTFFETDGKPKYYSNKTYPIDSTAAAQSIMTLMRFGENDLARKVLLWMIENMRAEIGYFYYQMGKYYAHKTSYMRWSNAYMYLAMSFYLYWGGIRGKD